MLVTSEKKIGYDGEPMAVEPLSHEEIRAAIDEPGHDWALSSQTLRRKYYSKFHRYVYAQWSRNKHAARRDAADQYLLMHEIATGGLSLQGYDGSPPPESFGPRSYTPVARRSEAVAWIRDAHAAIGPHQRAVIDLCCFPPNLSPKALFERFNPDTTLKERRKRTLGGQMIARAFDTLADFIAS